METTKGFVGGSFGVVRDVPLMQLYLTPLTFSSWISPFDLYNVELLFRNRMVGNILYRISRRNWIRQNVEMNVSLEKILFRIIWKNYYFPSTFWMVICRADFQLWIFTGCRSAVDIFFHLFFGQIYIRQNYGTKLSGRSVNWNEVKIFFLCIFQYKLFSIGVLKNITADVGAKKSLRIITVSVRFTATPSIKLRCLDN